MSMLLRRHRIALAVTVLALALLLAAPAILPPYYVSIASRIAIMAAFAVAFNVVFGMGGMPSLGHAAFFGVGGYVVGLGLTHWDWGFARIVVTTVLVGGVMGLVFGLLSQRVEGIYLLLMTLALGQAVWGLAFQMVDLTGGDTGLSGLSTDSIPLPVGTRESFHYFTVALCTAVVALLWWFMQSPVGRAIVGVRASATRMATLGYSVGAYKLWAFFVSGLVSAVLGALYAYQQGYVGVDNLDWTLSATVMLAAVVGGARHFLGPALGMAVLITLETVLSEYTERWMSVLGVIYILTIVLMPDGILGFRRRSPGSSPRENPPPAVAADDAGPHRPRIETETVGEVRP